MNRWNSLIKTAVFTLLVLAVPSVDAAAPAASVAASGMGRPRTGEFGAQSRLMAQRAAEVRSVRNLARAINGGPLVPSHRSGSGASFFRRTESHHVKNFRYAAVHKFSDGSIVVITQHNTRPR